MIKSGISRRNYIKMNRLAPGEYFWRVKLLGRDKSQITESPTYIFNVNQFVKKEEIAKKEEEKEEEKEEVKEEKTELTVLASVVDSEIYVNSVLRGKTRVTLSPDPGKFINIEVRKKGYEPYKERIKLKPGEKKELEAFLTLFAIEKENAILKISSSVKGASIFVDSKFQGKNKETIDVAPGKRVIVEVRLKGYRPFKKILKLRVNETRNIYARLAAIKKIGDDEEIIVKPRFRGRGKVRWKANLASRIMSDPVIYKNMIFVTTKNGSLVRLSRTGNRVWTARLGSVVRSTPAASNKAVYVVTTKGVLFSVNIRNGRVNWKKQIQGPLLFRSGPVAEKDMVFVATSHGLIYKFSAKGKEIWKKDLESGIFSSMAYYRGTLYVGTDQSRVHAVSAGSGRIKWTFKTDSRIIYSSPKIYKGTLFVGCYSGTFYAISSMLGHLKWKFKANKAILATPVFSGSNVYFGSENGMFYALKTGNGKKLWEFNTRNKIIAGPGISQGEVYVSSGRNVFSLDYKSGKLNWKKGFAYGINTSITIGAGGIYVGLSNGQVISLKL